MKELKTAFFTIIFLWLLAYGISLFIGNEDSFIGEGIAVVPIQGVITLEDSQDFFTGATSGSNTIINNLKKAKNNDNVKAVILDINSPGGTVVASREVANYVKELNEEKPVIALIREVGASGAYWIASGANWIISDELSITGSVGVMSSYLEYSGLMEKYGVKYERLIAGEYKDVGVPYRSLTNEEKKLMENKLDKIHEVFVNDVAKNRKLNNEQVTEIKTGFFYLGGEAKELGLVDELGGKESAIKKAKELGNLSDGNVVEYKTKKSILEILEGFSSRMFFNMGLGISYGLNANNEMEIMV